MAETEAKSPEFSVIIGRVATQDARRIFETLESLRGQRDAPPHEVVLADRLSDAATREIERRFPEVRVLGCPAGTGLPEMRARALEASRGRFVAVTEDHCVAPADWLASFARAIAEAPPGTVAVGGCVENAVADTALDHATFLCEYAAFLPPVPEGAAGVLPGMNIAYERAALARLDARELSAGFWEATAHPALARAGGRLVSTNRVRILHAKRFGARFFMEQRFLYSRHFAGTRFRPSRAAHRALAFAGAAILPALLLARIARAALAKGHARELLVALPWLAVFVATWAAGEMAGYAAGPGDALRHIE